MADPGRRPDLVLFDLDGTLIQSRDAAWTYFEDIAARHDLPFSSAEEFRTIFAGNFSDGLRAACADEATFRQVKAEYFAVLERDYTPRLVPGMREVVTHLAERTTLGVVSSNVLKVVRRVLETNGIATCIGHVFTGDVNPSKQDVIRKLQANVDFTLGRHCSPFYDESRRSISDSTATMYLVTDTVGDCEEALAAGAIPIGVTWGMHTEDELRRAGAAEVCLWPQELVVLLGQGPVLGSCSVPPVPGAAAPAARDGTRTPPQSRGDGPGGSPRDTDGQSILDRVRASNTTPARRRVAATNAAAGSCCGSCGDTGSAPYDRGTSPSGAGGAALVTPLRRARGLDPEVLEAVRRTGGC